MMKGHVTKKILINFIQETLSERKAMAVGNHLETCHSCRKNLAILSRALSPSDEKKIKPARSVLAGILDYYDNYSSDRAEQAPVPRRLRFRYAAIALGAACACVLIFALHTRLQYESAPIYASKVKGTVMADKHMLRKGQQVRPGVLLTTGDGSKMSIMYGKIMKLIAGPQSRISITKSHIDKKSGKIYIEIVIDRGSIFAETVKGWKLQYTLITPHGKVSSAGSRLAMRVEPHNTRVVVKDGSANISSNKGHSVDSEEGSGYFITDKEVKSAMESSDDDSNDNGTLYDNTVKDLLDDDDSDEGDSVIQ
jgi:hypothetical protein